MTTKREGHRWSRGARLRARYREIERLLELFRGSGLEEHLSEPRVAEQAAGTRVFTKIGQHLATRSDLLPPALLRELAGLQVHVARCPTALPWP